MTSLEDRQTDERVRLIDTWQAQQRAAEDPPRDHLLLGVSFLAVLFLLLAAVAVYRLNT